jgi:5'-3' exonuclease
MGIKYNYEILSPCGHNVDISELSHSKIAIDMMTYIVRLYKICKFRNEWYKKVIEFINNLIKQKITCVCVFDGYNKPPEKRKKNKYHKDLYKNTLFELNMFENGKTDVLIKKYNKSLSEIHSIIIEKIRQLQLNILFPQEEEIRNLIILLETLVDCEVYIADGEAENLCCYFLKTGKVDYVLSEDSDVLLYGANKFLMKFNGKTCKIFNLDEILSFHKLTFEELFCLCLLLGTDYDSGLEGFGYKKGYNLIKKEGENIKYKIQNYDRLREIFNSSQLYSKCYYSESEARRLVKMIICK